MKRLLLLLLTALLPPAARAQNLVKNGDAESGTLDNWSFTIERSTEQHHSGQASFTMLTADVECNEYIPVNPTGHYRLSAWFKSVDERKADLYLGLKPFDAEKKQIWPQNVNAVANTETELTAACRSGDTVVQVANAGNWKAEENYHIACDVDSSGEYKDLPNRNLTPGLARIEQIGKNWVVALCGPCGLNYPAGTKVRLHRDGYTLLYATIEPKFNSDFWRQLTGEIKGTAKAGGGTDRFWPGTKYVRLIILSFNGGREYFDDVTFEELK